jgi:anaerobic magnesium-protoporphyrin IX monomethyl ester cyclase
MRVCLVRLPSPFLIDDRAFPPLGLLAVATGLRQRGHDATVFDGDLDALPLDFPCYGFGPTTPEYPAALSCLARVKGVGARALIGGPFAFLSPDRCVSDGFDNVVVGDGEIMAEAALQDAARVVHARAGPLDSYPVIDRSFIDVCSYTFSLDGVRAAPVVSSRGCPYSCAFCLRTETALRERSAPHVIRELDYLIDSLHYKAIVFMDDLFIVNRRRVSDIAQHLNQREIAWRCMVRADVLVKWGEPFARMMADYGCRMVGMGIESGSDKILQVCNKAETVDTIRQAVLLCKSVGIQVKGYFILGLPGETEATMDETEALLESLSLDDLDIKVYQPYPGSLIWENKRAYDIDWDEMPHEAMFYKGKPGMYYGNVRTSALSNERIVSRQQELEARFKRWL